MSKQAMATHGNLLVPFVARRSDESPGSVRVRWVPTGRGMRMTIPGHPRDRFGFLWYPDLPRGRGVPEFGQVHSGRHRECMDGPRCQVCSRRLNPGQALWPMELDTLGLVTISATPRITAHPPTCAKCRKLAEAQCPHIRREGMVWLRGTVTPWGVKADVYNPRTGDILKRSAYLENGHEAAEVALARQRIMVIADGYEEVL